MGSTAVGNPFNVGVPAPSDVRCLREGRKIISRSILTNQLTFNNVSSPFGAPGYKGAFVTFDFSDQQITQIVTLLISVAYLNNSTPMVIFIDDGSGIPTRLANPSTSGSEFMHYIVRPFLSASKQVNATIYIPSGAAPPINGGQIIVGVANFPMKSMSVSTTASL